MFYSHEILTSRKYGVATIWLVATLGARSSHSKKLTRKAITEVDVSKACGTIMEPEAPMALRLQSNLMYGVARVYSQQCSYVLSDAQAAQTAMRALLKGGRNDLDLSLGKAKPEQLMLLDDPAFLADMALPPLELDISRMSLEPDSQSSQSMMSIRGRSNSTSSNSLPPLNLGSSSGNSIGYQLPFDDPFAAGSGQKPYIGNDGAFGEEVMYQDEVFNFDPEGNLIDIPSPARRTQNHLGSDSAASARVRGEHEAGHVLPSHDVEGDFNMYNYGEDDVPLPDAEPFPEGGVFMTGGLGGNDQPLPIIGNDRIHSSPFQSSEPSTITADAPLAKTKKPKSKKALEIDPVIELRNSALAAFRDEYIENMAAASLVKKNHKAATAAKKNAFHFVYGTGLLGVGDGLGSLKFSHPLNIFAGDYLFSKITGKPIPSTPSKRSKRALAVDNEEEQQTPKRPRQAEDEIGRGFNDEDIPMNFEDEFNHEHSVELGRNAPSALQDYPSSALMPWNISASLRGSKTGSLARRLTSASPLIGRGSVMLGEIDGFSLMQEGDEVMYGRDDDFGSPPGGFSNGNAASSSHAHGFESQGAASEFEVFGAAANVDTQTAGTSQWVRQALDKESNNFFEYVRNTIDEKTVAGEDVEMEGEEKGGFVTFEELFSVDANSCVVAAQAFYHVLCLATKRRVWVQQDGVENGEIGGDIRIGVVEVV